jgi:hypothetical protein
MIVEPLGEFRDDGNLRNCANYPEAVPPRAPRTMRLAIANNVRNGGQISGRLVAAGIQDWPALESSRGDLPTRLSTRTAP